MDELLNADFNYFMNYDETFPDWIDVLFDAFMEG